MRPVAQDQNEVGVDDRGQAVGDDEARPAAHKAVHGLLDEKLRARVDIGRRFIENQQFALREQRARNGQQLLLAGGDGRGIAADDRIVALWKRADKVVTVRLVAARMISSRVASGLPKATFSAIVPPKEPRVLQDMPKRSRRGGAGIVRDVAPAPAEYCRNRRRRSA